MNGRIAAALCMSILLLLAGSASGQSRNVARATKTAGTDSVDESEQRAGPA